MFDTHNNPALETLLKEGYKLTPATMAHRLTRGAWIPARHLLHISNIITQALRRGNARIIVTMPPRHGKSEFISVNTPIWYLDRHPDRKIILTSYGADLATGFSKRVRDTFISEPSELSTRLQKDKSKVDDFNTTQGGAMYAVGIGGAITGRGSHLLLCDDYIKNAEESFSEALRNKIWDWWLSTAFTRLEPGGNVIVLATRWNSDDLIGRLKREQPDIWTEIRLPAFAEANDPLGRTIGEPLWPERYDEEALAGIKVALGSYWFSAMYQQRPLSSMNGAVTGDMLKVVDILPHYSKLKWVRSWDFASTESAKADYSAGPKVAYDQSTGNLYIADMAHFRKSPKGTESEVERCAKEDGTGVPIWIEQEPGSAGKIVIDHYALDVLPQYTVKGLRPTGPLPVRATPLLAAIEAGKVYMLRGTWNQPLRDEVDTFPDGAHDDQIAALAIAAEKLLRGAKQHIVWGTDSHSVSSGWSTPSKGGIVRGVTW